MAEEDPVQRLRDSRPPATDATTYLTIIDMSLKPSTAPSVLPALHDILQDADLTSEIGWDLVDVLIPFEGSESCLDAVARLGNPREVILKVLEALEKTADSEDEKKAEGQFVTLCSMLGVLHKRLKVKAPSRFLQTTLDTVNRTFKASSVEATTAVIGLVRSLSGQKRPPLPTRKSSTVVATLPSKKETAPDPEAADVDADDGQVSHRLLQCFITCCIANYVNVNQLEWAARLLEYTYPEKIVPRRGTVMKAYNEVDELKERDELIGQLAGLADDLGLNKLTAAEVTAALTSPVASSPLEEEGSPLSTEGYVCLLAYWMFSSDIFEAHHALPANIFIFPTIHELLGKLLEDPEAAIKTSPGTIESCIVIALWLHTHDLMAAPDSTAEFMPLHHLLTLIAVFHSNIRVRNAATATAGHILHAAPEDDRLAILEDLTENCMFSTLQACAVTWLKDEILAASPESRFASQDCLETLQYTLFPDLTRLLTDDTDALLEFWAEGSPYHLQVSNFALFLLSSEKYKHLTPAGMAAAIEHRYVEPLLAAVDKLEAALAEEKEQGEMVMRLSVLKDVLGRIPLQ